MSELGFERRPTAASHSELTSGHDVTNLLSTINTNVKQSKADQILRLLQDHDKLNDGVEEIEDVDEEYNNIREENVICDSDTLTDSSSDGETEITIAEKEEVLDSDEKVMIRNQRSKEGRSKTSIGFYGFERNDSGIHLEHESEMMAADGGPLDTRDLNIRPKSSYVRRGQLYRKNTEIDIDLRSASKNDKLDGRSGEITHRSVSAKFRPQSRHGRDSKLRLERKIEMVEATPIVAPPAEEVPVPVKEDVSKTGTGGGGATSTFNRRFDSSRTPVPRRGSKRSKGFCEDIPDTGVNAPTHISNDYSNPPRNVHPVYSDMETNVQEVSVSAVPNVSQVTKSQTQSMSNAHVSRQASIQSNHHRTLPSQPVKAEAQTRYHKDTHIVGQHQQQQQQQQQYQQQQQQQQQQQHHQQQQYRQQHNAQHMTYANTRSDTVLTTASSVKPEINTSVANTNTLPLKRTPSNSNSSYRPTNPEPITARPMGRTDMRPGTRQRRLTRRYMQPTQTSMNSVRPTSESVILARQRTEKNLLKKQTESRPHSEKIVPSSKTVLSVSNNPAQGPQTHIMSKEGVQQSSHVGAGGFRGYDPGHRMKPSSRSRDVQADLTLPRSGMFGPRKSLALMKLPPLEATLAAKKKERGLSLAQRETCV